MDHARTILIVDDNPDLVAAMTATLELLTNHRVVSALNGVEGLEKALELRPDCIIVDVRMPGLDGYQLVRTLRGDPDTTAIPLVILTAMTTERDRFQGMAAGADQYLIKPIEPEQLVKAIDIAISLSQRDRTNRYERLAADDEGAMQ